MNFKRGVNISLNLIEGEETSSLILSPSENPKGFPMRGRYTPSMSPLLGGELKWECKVVIQKR